MDLIAALETYAIPYRRSFRQDEIWLCCPFCQESRFRLGVNAASGLMHCFNCDMRSRNPDYTFRVLGEQLRLGGLEAAAGAVRAPGPQLGPPALPEDFQALPGGLQGPPREDYWGRRAYRYLRGRGVTPRQMAARRVGYSLAGPYGYRVVFPIRWQGRLRGLVARAFVPGVLPPYKNSPGERYLYNVPSPVKRRAVVLVEGVFDTLSVERAVGGEVASVGVLGHALTARNLEQLEPFRRVYLWPDPDRAGVDGFLRMARQLTGEKKTVFIVVPKDQDQDPAELPPFQIRYRLRQAKPYSVDLENRLRAWLAFKEV